jgi:exodeoxyribonuclease VII small subunit
MSESNTPTFEDEFDELENVVARIDSGELSLEESITAFERGVALVRSLNQKLDEVDRRIEVLTRDTAGGLRVSPYDGDLGLGDDRSENADDDIPE